MKHPLQPTLLLIVLFVSAQLLGLVIISEYIDIRKSQETGTTVQRAEIYERIGIEPPTVDNESFTFLYIFLAVIFGTLIVLLIIKLKKRTLWKLWYLLAIFSSLLVALNPFVFGLLKNPSFAYMVTIVTAVIFSFLKVFRPNIFVHNITELLIYGGIAALLVPIVNLVSAVALLVLVSVYDAYAVWKSKHMVKMAEFQTQTNVFAGMSIPYNFKGIKPGRKMSKESNVKSAILGGGDVAFPLIFSGVVLKTTGSYFSAVVITAAAAIALSILLVKGQKGKFYPAMPFLSFGCFLGYLIALLI
ncbi:MAG: presenilin family intramembrane aspartyl protease [Candidatus Woesearchaeota archaeon]